MIKVEVCFATSDQQWLIPLSLNAGSTVINAITASGILEQVCDIDLQHNVGIFSKKVGLETILQDKDRVEIYRPLLLSPNQSRLQRAKRS